MYLVYGSTAIKHWFPDFREPNDFDVITDVVIPNRKWREYYWIDAFKFLDRNKDWEFVDPDYLYTIKLSHLSYDVWNWDKHMKDALFLRDKGCKINMEFYKMLLKDWELIHWEKRINLKVKNEEFFKPKIERKFDHDWLHEQLAINWEPMHYRIRPDMSSPMCSKKMWDSLSHKEKMECAIEEIYVLTAERYIFSPWNKTPMHLAKIKVIKNMIMSTTWGWFNLFLKENFLELVRMNPKKIISKIGELWLEN